MLRRILQQFLLLSRYWLIKNCSIGTGSRKILLGTFITLRAQIPMPGIFARSLPREAQRPPIDSFPLFLLELAQFLPGLWGELRLWPPATPLRKLANHDESHILLCSIRQQFISPHPPSPFRSPPHHSWTHNRRLFRPILSPPGSQRHRENQIIMILLPPG